MYLKYLINIFFQIMKSVIITDNTRQKDNIHLDAIKTNRQDMVMRYEGAKSWNSIWNKNIMHKGSIAMSFKSYLLSMMQC